MPKPDDSEPKRFPNPNEFLLPQVENIPTTTNISAFNQQNRQFMPQSINGISPPTQSDNILCMPPPPQQLIMPPPPVPIDETKEKQPQLVPEHKEHSFLQEESFSSPMVAMPPQNSSQFASNQYSSPISTQHQQPPPPINTSAYQPFLAYGAPPSSGGQFPFQPSQYYQMSNQQMFGGQQQHEITQQFNQQTSGSQQVPIQPFFAGFFNFLKINSVNERHPNIT